MFKPQASEAQRQLAPTIGESEMVLRPDTPLRRMMKKVAASGNEGFFGVWSESDGTIRGGFFATFDPTLSEQSVEMSEQMMTSLKVPIIGFRYSLAESVAYIEGLGKRTGIANWRHEGGYFKVEITAGVEETKRAVSFYEKLFNQA